MIHNDTVESFFRLQIEQWPEAAERYKALERQQGKSFIANSQQFRVTYNPARVVSVTAGTSPDINKVCPLCAGNRPNEQLSMACCEGYTLLVNPFPIFSRHFTIAGNEHIPQQIETSFTDLLEISRALEGYTVFYNGPEAGASLPQHLHFQAAPANELPFHTIYPEFCETVSSYRSAEIQLVNSGYSSSFLLKASQQEHASVLFKRLYEALTDEEKKKNNIVVWYTNHKWYIRIYVRRKHRPDIYFKALPEKLTVSPAAAEMQGVIVTINQTDFDRINPELWKGITEEVNITSERACEIADSIKSANQPYKVEVGILEEPILEFNLLTPYIIGDKEIVGRQTVNYEQGCIYYNGSLYKELLFTPCADAGKIEVTGVTIGKEFHWQQQQVQQFSGSWKVIPVNGKLAGINIIDMEEYLESVVSSEMSANAPIELLKAHAIIARTWLVRMIERVPAKPSLNNENLVWHEAEEHEFYDVCADDHCQRYQGISQITNPTAIEAVKLTRGQIITYDGEVIDARYSKCCGGITEKFSTAWGDVDYPYLVPVRDNKENSNTQAQAWCNVTNPVVIRAIMKEYDQKTTNFFRWEVAYTSNELSEIIHQKTGINPGELQAIEPLEIGPSGRIWKLRITGTLHSWVIGKELEIRRVLSPTHLYSSAFVVETEKDESGKIIRFILRGAGWGHGVGLCQIGAANMAVNGYLYNEIIYHYYKGTDIRKIYE